MLGFVSAADRGQGDQILASVALALEQAGHALAGVVQINTADLPERPSVMVLRLLSDGSVIQISQALGPGSKGCRLDPAGLEEAVGRVEAALQRTRPDVLIVNKFGKHEAEGRGFRLLIGQAMADGVPVLTSVAARNMVSFQAFSEGTATALPSDPAAVLDWCLAQCRSRAAV